MVQVKHLEQCLVNCLLLFLFCLHGSEKGRNLELLGSFAHAKQDFKKKGSQWLFQVILLYDCLDSLDFYILPARTIWEYVWLEICQCYPRLGPWERLRTEAVGTKFHALNSFQKMGKTQRSSD